MIELDTGLGKQESRKFLVPERELITNKDISELFGSNYRKLVADRARQLSIEEELQFFDAPRPHNGSQAVYLAEQFVGDHLVLVPVLKPHMQTSKHHHEAPMGNEIYIHIAGESLVTAGNKEQLLNQRQPRIEIPLGVVHQVRTQKDPVLTLIIMENARLVSPGRLHVKDMQ